MSKTTQQAEKTAAALQGLQSRLEPQNGEDLGQELQAYFSASAPQPAAPAASDGMTDEILERVIDGVAERILRSWDTTSLKSAVVERLVQRVTDRLSKGAFPDSGMRTKS